MSADDDAIQCRWRAVLDELVIKHGNQRVLAPKLDLSQARLSQVKNGDRVNGDIKFAVVRLLGYVPEDLLDDPDIAAVRSAPALVAAPAEPAKKLPRYGDHPDWRELCEAARLELPDPADKGWDEVFEWMEGKEYQLDTPLTPAIVAGFARWARGNQWIVRTRVRTQTGPQKPATRKRAWNES